jgi:3-oxoacyl-[acyl-carrier protein] reductase
MTLEGHTALVTGGSKGIGRGIALELARQGARVAISYRRDGPEVQETMAALAEMGRPALAVAGDVRRADQVRAMVAEVTAQPGTLDILVNNAGLGLFTALLERSEDGWDAMVDTNLKGAFLSAQAAAPGMMAQRWGRIVNITSTGSIRVVRGVGAYCASKAGLAMLTQALAVEPGRHGINAKTVVRQLTQQRCSPPHDHYRDDEADAAAPACPRRAGRAAGLRAPSASYRCRCGARTCARSSVTAQR